MDKSHVEHTIRFIEDEDLNICKRYVFLSDEIHEASWRRNQYLTPCIERIHLSKLSDSTEDDCRTK